MQHISKNFAAAFISTNFTHTHLNSLKFKTSLVTMLSFIGQNDIAKIKTHHEAEQLARNKYEFNFIDTNCKVLKTTIKGLGMITENFAPTSIASSQLSLILMAATPFRSSTTCASRQLTLLRVLFCCRTSQVAQI